MKHPIKKSQNPAAPLSDVLAFAVAVPGVQDYDTITVDRNLLRQQIDFLEHVDICSLGPEEKDYLEGVLNLLGGIHDLGWPPKAEEEGVKP